MKETQSSNIYLDIISSSILRVISAAGSTIFVLFGDYIFENDEIGYVIKVVSFAITCSLFIKLGADRYAISLILEKRLIFAVNIIQSSFRDIVIFTLLVFTICTLFNVTIFSEGNNYIVLLLTILISLHSFSNAIYVATGKTNYACLTQTGFTYILAFTPALILSKYFTNISAIIYFLAATLIQLILIPPSLLRINNLFTPFYEIRKKISFFSTNLFTIYNTAIIFLIFSMFYDNSGILELKQIERIAGLVCFINIIFMLFIPSRIFRYDDSNNKKVFDFKKYFKFQILALIFSTLILILIYVVSELNFLDLSSKINWDTAWPLYIAYWVNGITGPSIYILTLNNDENFIATINTIYCIILSLILIILLDTIDIYSVICIWSTLFILANIFIYARLLTSIKYAHKTKI